MRTVISQTQPVVRQEHREQTLMEMEQLMYFRMEAHQKALLQMIPLTVHWMKRTPRPLAL